MKALLPTLHPEMEQGVIAALFFAQIVRERLVDQFDAWLQAALHSPLRELRSFARGIQRDYDAVLAALRLPWSNGLLEGHVNRLKFLKRQMFGRAKFDLLRLRVLTYVT
jgi:transposase